MEVAVYGPMVGYIVGLMLMKRNSIPHALELRHFCIKPLICGGYIDIDGLMQKRP